MEKPASISRFALNRVYKKQGQFDLIEAKPDKRLPSDNSPAGRFTRVSSGLPVSPGGLLRPTRYGYCDDGRMTST